MTSNVSPYLITLDAAKNIEHLEMLRVPLGHVDYTAAEQRVMSLWPTLPPKAFTHAVLYRDNVGSGSAAWRHVPGKSAARFRRWEKRQLRRGLVAYVHPGP